MAGTVGDVGNLVHIGTFGTTQEAVGGVNQDLDEVYVLPFVEATDVVGLCDFALMEDKINRPGMVFHIEPVTHVLTFAIHRQRLAVADIVDEQRDELLGELIRAVVVGAVSDNGWKAVGIMESSHEVVARSLGGTIWTVRLIFQILGEELLAVCQNDACQKMPLW